MKTNNQILVPDKETQICFFCKSKRVGVQDGNVIYKCGTQVKYSSDGNKKTKRSQECQKKQTLIG